MKKSIENVVCVTSGAGSAALACLDLLVSFGMRKENIFVTDRAGVIYEGRSHNTGVHKARYAQETKLRTVSTPG